jgi:hypothetical protein
VRTVWRRGGVVAAALNTALASHDTVSLSFTGIGSASSSFVSAALIPSLRSMSVDEFKRRVRTIDASWQVTEVVRRRVQLELATAA